jgi:competence protein ComEA
MSRSLPQGVARASRGLRRAVHSIRGRLVAAISAARTWRWGSVLGRVLLAALGLVLLGAIGRSALARNILSPEVPAPVVAAVAAAAAGRGTDTPPSATPAVESPPAPPAAPPPAAAASVAAARGRATPDDPVYLNQATLSDLHRLPGVGPKRAEAILSLRNRLGHFRQIEDLLKVKGIGRSSLKKLRPLVRLDPPPVRPGDGGETDAR